MKSPDIVLSAGDEGELVRLLQHQLFCRSISGIFDDATQSRLRGWQLAKGLDPNGVVDLDTAKELGWTV